MDNTFKNIINNIRENPEPHNLLQVQMLILNVELIDVLTKAKLDESSIDRVVELLEDFMKIYEKVSSFKPELVNPMYTKDQVREIDEKFTILISSFQTEIFNQPIGEA